MAFNSLVKFLSVFWLIFPLALADRSFKGDRPGASVGKIEASLPYHVHVADATDKKVV
jgi:hypothetical protein